ncbi:hypothetical protein [Massilia endophytica]|uniref:hypothetical protein n=1 Tax=Massilia endophytica TaxID=2899220 RepID=UPI001E6539CB|nr:hypothetical protein [Massilia endophytica]UGQ44938.1 hypothetical protein LSQ66_14140 [Massilia endophytica]
MSACYIVSVKWTRRDSPYITFWRPDDCGYAWPLSWAGRYAEDDVLANKDYYHNGVSTIAVPCMLVDNLGVPPVKGTVDGDAGPVVLNNRTNWNCILEFALPDPLDKPQPQYKGARKAMGKEAGK